MATKFKVKRKDDKKSNLGNINRELGSSGTVKIQGFIEEEYNSALQGLAALSTFDQMRRADPAVASVILAIELPIRATQWYIDPAVDPDTGQSTPESEEVASFIEQALFHRMETTWDDFLRQSLTMLPFGFSVFEKVYRFPDEDGNIWLRKLAPRLQTSIYKWETVEGDPGITQILPVAKDIETKDKTQENANEHQISIPRDKLLTFSYRKEGDNDMGISVLRAAYRPWYIKDNLIKFNAIKHERFSSGVPVITLPKGAGNSEEEEAGGILRNLRTTEESHVILPADWKFEFATLPTGSGNDMGDDLAFYNREISRSVLAQFLELGASETGSYALSEDQSSLFLLSTTAIAKQIAETITRNVIKELVELNFNTDMIPSLKFRKIGDVEYTKFAQSLNTLSSAGIITPDADLEAHARKFLDLPPRSEEEDQNGNPSNRNAKSDKTKTENPAEDDSTGKPNKPAPVKANEFLFGEQDQEYAEFGSLIDNDYIRKLQNETQTPEDLAELKKKGLIINEAENDFERPLTLAERKVNLRSLDRTISSLTDRLETSLAKIAKKQKDDIILQVKVAVQKGDFELLGKISVKNNLKEDLARELTTVQKEAFEIGKKTASTEMKVLTPGTKPEIKGVMRVQNQAVAEKVGVTIETTAKTAVAQSAARYGGAISALPSALAVAAVTEALDKIIDRQIKSLTTLTTVGAINTGRTTIFERYPEKIHAFQWSAILDRRTCFKCMSLDGRVVKAGGSEFFDHTPPIHHACRCIWVEILKEEVVKPRITGIPKSIKPDTSLDTFTQLKRPLLAKNAPAGALVSRDIKQRQAKLGKLKKSGKFPNRQAQHKTAITKLQKSIRTSDDIKPPLTRGELLEKLEAQGIKFK